MYDEHDAGRAVSDVLAIIDGLIAKAPELRKAGVRTLTIGDFACELAPTAPEAAAMVVLTTPAPVDDLAPLDDPMSYNLPPGARVPGFDRPGNGAA